MTRQSRSRSGRTSRPPARQAKPPASTPLRWWNRITKTILGAGALAAAIAAVLALVLSFLPAHAHQNVARFSSVQMLGQVPLSEYQQRSAVFQAQSTGHSMKRSSRLVVAVTGQASPPSVQGGAIATPLPSPTGTVPLPSPTGTVPLPSPTGTVPLPSPTGTVPLPSPTGTIPSPSPTSTGTTSPTNTTSPTGGASPSGGILSLGPSGMSTNDLCRYARDVAALARDEMPSESLSGSNCSRLSAFAVLIVHTVAVDSHGDLVPAVVAANRLVGILGQTQAVSGPGHKRDPLGELVNVNVELAGLQGKPVFLSWSIFQVGGHTALFGKWLSDFVAYRLETTTNDDTGNLKMWIPLPKLPGPYFISLTMTTDGASLASMDSGPFG
jgi:hypothetical protein